MTTRLVFLIILISSNSEKSLAQTQITLKGAVDSAISRNPQYQLATLNASLSKENLSQARYNALPSLLMSSQQSFNWGRSLDLSTYAYTNQRIFLLNGTLSTQFSLYQGGQLRSQIVRSKMLLDADQTEVSKVRNELTIAVLMSYMQVLTFQESVKIANEQLKFANIHADKVKKSFNAGSKTLADIGQANSQRSDANLNLATVNNQLEVSLLELKQLLGMPNEQIKVVAPNLKTRNPISDTAGYISIVIKNDPAIHLVNVQTSAALQDLKTFKGALYPTVSVFGSIGSNYSNARQLISGTKFSGLDTIGFVNGTFQQVVAPNFKSLTTPYPFNRQFSDNFYQTIGLSLQVPIFNRFLARTNLSKARIAHLSAQVKEQETILNLTTVIKKALLDQRLAMIQLDIGQEKLSSLKQVFNVSEKRFLAGLLNSIEFSQVLTEFNKAQLDLIQYQYNVIFRNIILNFYERNELDFVQ